MVKGVRLPPKLPAANGQLDLGFRVTQRELEAIRTGMKVHTAARAPKLTWDGWKCIAIACAIASDHIKATTGGRTRTPDYTRPMSGFLRATGFNFLNPDDLACAVRLLPLWEKIDRWRETLSAQQREKQNNPRQVEEAMRAANVKRSGHD